MFRRRRPLLRAAVVGGGAYVAGKSVARRSAERQQTEDEQNERIGDLEQQQAPPEPTPAPAEPAPAPSMLDQLNQLAALHEQGALSDDEFSSAKAKLLGWAWRCRPALWLSHSPVPRLGDDVVDAGRHQPEAEYQGDDDNDLVGMGSDPEA